MSRARRRLPSLGLLADSPPITAGRGWKRRCTGQPLFETVYREGSKAMENAVLNKRAGVSR
jgi:hypothetical protein